MLTHLPTRLIHPLAIFLIEDEVIKHAFVAANSERVPIVATLTDIDTDNAVTWTFRHPVQVIANP